MKSSIFVHSASSTRYESLHYVSHTHSKYRFQDIVRPLYFVKPPILPASRMDKFMDVAYTNILIIQKCHRGHLDILSDRCYAVGDVFLDLVEEFRGTYHSYITSLPSAIAMLKEEIERNAAFGLFCFFVSEVRMYAV